MNRKSFLPKKIIILRGQARSRDNIYIYNPNLSRKTSFAERIFISPSFEITSFSPLNAFYRSILRSDLRRPSSIFFLNCSISFSSIYL